MLYLASLIAYAADTIPNVSNFSSLTKLLVGASQVLITIATLGMVVGVLYGGFQYLTGAGNEEQTAQGRRTILYSVLGLVIVLAAWALANFIIHRITGSSINQLGNEIFNQEFAPTGTPAPIP